jgi:multiple sugar transport system permease protein
MTQTITPHKKRGRSRVASTIFYICLVIWPILQFLVFYVWINAKSIIMAFQVYDDTGAMHWGFGNFALVLTHRADNPNLDDVIRGGAMSLLSYALTVVVTIPLGLFSAYYIGKKMPGSGFFRVVLFLPSIIPEIVLVVLYKYFVINALPDYMAALGWQNFGDWLSKSNGATWQQQYFMVMFFTLIITGFGTSVLMYSNAMSKVSVEVLDAAKIDGARGWSEFWHIVLPAVWPTVMVFLVSGVSSIFLNQIHLWSFYDYDAPVQLQTYGYILYHESTEIITTSAVNDSKANILSAFGLLMTAVAIPLTFLVKWALQKIGPKED